MWCLLVLVTSMRRCIFLFLFFEFGFVNSFLVFLFFIFFIFFLVFFILYLLWWLITILLKGRTRARFGSSHYYAQLFLFLFFLLLCSSLCAPAHPYVLLRLVLMSSSSSLCAASWKNVLVFNFNKLHTIIGL